MRLIDADAIENDLGIEDRDLYVQHILDSAPTVEAEPRWTAVTDRLPKYGESVLCYFGDAEDFGVNHIIDDEDGEWLIDGVIAWMPLPEPYTMDEVAP